MSKPWECEPDSVDFKFCGLKCAMRRGPLQHWCGYVGVSTVHPLYGKTYMDKIEIPPSFPQEIEKEEYLQCLFNVHGGVTFAEENCPGSEKDGLWYFGFDCAHHNDLVPGHREYLRSSSSITQTGVYRTAGFVRAECKKLARQLIKWMDYVLPAPVPDEADKLIMCIHRRGEFHAKESL